ncbi:MAG TPA: hypothetical protein VMF61_02915, partial [Candidatus Acidoferrales bacterium]|nr:hypothetical protein [Candidatus Acidoferrales bacterium]
AVWLGNDDYSRMDESYGGNIPARIWARFMKAALAGTKPHDFVMPQEEVAKVARCGGGYEYYIKGTEPQSCGDSVTQYNGDPSAARYVPSAAEPTVPPADATPPPDSVGDGTQYEMLDSPAPTLPPGNQASPSAAPSSSTVPQPSSSPRR